MKLRLIYLWKYRVPALSADDKMGGNNGIRDAIWILLFIKKIERGRNGTPASEATDRPTDRPSI